MADETPPAARSTDVRGPYARGRAREHELLQAVLRIVARDGLSAVSHRTVAKEAGIPSGSVTYYFPKRMDLVRGAFSDLTRRQLTRIEALVAERPGGGLEALADLAATVTMGELEGDPSTAAAEFELILAIGRDPDLAPEYRAFEERLEEIQVGLARSIGSTDPHRDGRIVQAYLRGVQLAAIAARPEDRPTADDVRRDLIHLLRSLVGAG